MTNPVEDIIDEITVHDNVLGWMATEVQTAANESLWYPAIASLFTLTEQTLKWATDSDETFYKVIGLANEQSLINETEKDLLHHIRKIRNSYVHANFHAGTFVLDGLIYQINDSGTSERLYEMYSEPVMALILKIVRD